MISVPGNANNNLVEDLYNVLNLGLKITHEKARIARSHLFAYQIITVFVKDITSKLRRIKGKNQLIQSKKSVSAGRKGNARTLGLSGSLIFFYEFSVACKTYKAKFRIFSH